jgi:hypothetical protein
MRKTRQGRDLVLGEWRRQRERAFARFTGDKSAPAAEDAAGPPSPPPAPRAESGPGRMIKCKHFAPHKPDRIFSGP